MSEYGYFVQLQPDPAGGLLVTCADIPELITFGTDREDALSSAREALAVALFGYLAEARDLPDRKTAEGDLIAPQTIDVLKIAVIQAWRRSGWPKSEFARRLKVDEKEARRILDPDCATKLSRLEEALSLLGQRVRVAVEPA